MELYVNKDSLILSVLLYYTQGHSSFIVTVTRGVSPRPTAEMCGVRHPPSPAPSGPAATAASMCACSGEGVDDPSPDPTVFSEDHSQGRGPPLSLTLRQRANDVGCSAAHGGRGPGCYVLLNVARRWHQQAPQLRQRNWGVATCQARRELEYDVQEERPETGH